MDDLVWWGDGKDAVRDALAQARAYARERLRLTVKTPVQIGRSRAGLPFCGYRVLPGRLLLSRRRKRRYAECRRHWEDACAAGRIDARALQAGYAAARLPQAYATSNLDRRAGGRKAGANRVLRGGSWNDDARNVRAAYRNANHPDNRNDNNGFRCARARERTGGSEPEQTAVPGVPPGSPKPQGRRRASSGSGRPANARRPAALQSS